MKVEDGNIEGTLYVVATPIGNLDDMSGRAVDILNSVDLVAAEDTRAAGILFDRWDIDTDTTSFHDHNKESKTPQLIEKLNNGFDLALISEAGTPGISDPGFFLVREARSTDLGVIAIPGPSAASAALSVSGLPSDSFYFLGFLPRRKGAKDILRQVGMLDTSLIIYESPSRVKKLLSIICDVLGDRTVSVSREITKIYEEHLTDTASSLVQHFSEVEPRGEFTIVVAPEGYRIDGSDDEDSGSKEVHFDDEIVLEQVDMLVEAGFKLSRAAKIAAKGHGLAKSDVYRAYLNYSNE